MKESNREPWERMPGETALQYKYFETYLNINPVERTVRAAAKIWGKSKDTLEKYCTDNNWVERAAAWDDEQAKIARAEQQKEIAEMRQRQARIAKKALDKVEQFIDKLNISDINASNASKLMDSASKLERIARGDIGEVIEERDGGVAEPAVTFYIPDNQRN